MSQSGTYIGQLNENNQRHGFGKWMSSSLSQELAFGDWILDNLIDGTVHKLVEDEIQVETYNQTK